jgi:hypothetical protein
MAGVGGFGVSVFCANVVRVVGDSMVDVDGSVVVESVVWVVGDLFLFLRFPPTGDTLTSEGVAGSLVDVVVAILASVVGEAGAAAFSFLFLRFPPTGDTLTSEGATGSLVDVGVAILASVVGEAGEAAFFFLFLRFPPTGDTLTSEGAAGSLVDVVVAILASMVDVLGDSMVVESAVIDSMVGVIGSLVGSMIVEFVVVGSLVDVELATFASVVGGSRAEALDAATIRCLFCLLLASLSLNFIFLFFANSFLSCLVVVGCVVVGSVVGG